MSVSLTVNGTPTEIDADPQTPLLWALRDNLNMTGTKYGCGIAQCGACTVHLNGIAVRSCQYPLAAAVGQDVVTIEGLSPDNSHPLQKRWAEMNVPQCGYCQAGMLMAAAALLNQVPDPTDQQIEQYVNNICRCGTYTRVKAAIHRAAEDLRAEA
jgi:isoquinoline 1-oxidoreductase subunit alpha